MKFDKKQTIISGFFLLVIVVGFTIKKVLPPWHPARNVVHLLFGILFLIVFFYSIYNVFRLKRSHPKEHPGSNPIRQKKELFWNIVLLLASAWGAFIYFADFLGYSLYPL